MSAESLFVVVDSGRPVTAFTDKDDLKSYLKRMRGTFNRPLAYGIDDGNGSVIMTVSRVMSGGPDARSKR